MRFSIITKVNKNYKEVFEGFDEKLFIKLAPPFPKVSLQRFDGSNIGNKVIIKLHFIFFSQIWESEITDKKEEENEIFFVDEGIKLPFFLKKWKHKHIIKQDENNINKSLIIDDIYFQTPFKLFNFIMFPAIWLQFAYRKPIYKRFFNTK